MDKIENSKAEVKSQRHPKILKYERKVRRYRQFGRHNMHLRFPESEQKLSKIRGKNIKINTLFQIFRSYRLT